MIKLIYATFGSKEEAVSVAKLLLTEKLIACANIIDGSTSIYRWQNEIQQQSEVILFAKTTAEKTTQTISRIKELHSYELPCILTLPVDDGFAQFVKWVEQEVF